MDWMGYVPHSLTVPGHLALGGGVILERCGVFGEEVMSGRIG